MQRAARSGIVKHDANDAAGATDGHFGEKSHQNAFELWIT
jgi:hypothetical protein